MHPWKPEDPSPSDSIPACAAPNQRQRHSTVVVWVSPQTPAVNYCAWTQNGNLIYTVGWEEGSWASVRTVRMMMVVEGGCFTGSDYVFGNEEWGGARGGHDPAKA